MIQLIKYDIYRFSSPNSHYDSDDGFALAHNLNPDVNIGATETIETLSIDRMSGRNDIYTKYLGLTTSVLT